MAEAVPRRRPRFFYGWVIVAVSCVAEATAFGAGITAFGVFLQPMTHALGWSRTVFTGAITLQSVANLLISPIAGVAVDYLGPRVVMVLGTTVACVSFLLLSRVNEPWEFYLLFALATALGLAELGGLVTGATISKWFIRMRGRALAISSTGLNIGAVVFGPLLAYAIGTVGWRMAWAVLGLLVAVLIMAPAIFLMKRTPEDVGLLPDGAAPDEPSSAGPPSAATGTARREEPRWGVRDALREPVTWVVVVSSNLVGLGLTTLNYHQVSYFTDIGLSLQAASLIFALSHLITIPAKLLWGFLSERVPVRFCLVGCDLSRALAIVILLVGRSQERLLWYALFSGLGQGVGALQVKIMADYYGRAFIGSIRGVLTPFSLLANLGGPLFAAYIFDQTSSYEAAFWVASGALVLGAILVAPAKPPVARPAEPAPVSSAAS